MRRALYRDGDQLKFEFKGWPWDGQNPRDLTKAADFFRLPPRGAPAEPMNAVAVQLELFPEGTPYGA